MGTPRAAPTAPLLMEMENFQYSVQLNDKDWAEFSAVADECGLLQASLASGDELLSSDLDQADSRGGSPPGPLPLLPGQLAAVGSCWQGCEEGANAAAWQLVSRSQYDLGLAWGASQQTPCTSEQLEARSPPDSSASPPGQCPSFPGPASGSKMQRLLQGPAPSPTGEAPRSPEPAGRSSALRRPPDSLNRKKKRSTAGKGAGPSLGPSLTQPSTPPLTEVSPEGLGLARSKGKGLGAAKAKLTAGAGQDELGTGSRGTPESSFIQGLDVEPSTPGPGPEGPADPLKTPFRDKPPPDTAASSPKSRPPPNMATSTPASRPPPDTAASTPLPDIAAFSPESRPPPDTAVSTPVSTALSNMAVSTAVSRPLSDTAVSTPVSRAPPKTATTTPTSRAAPDTAVSTPVSTALSDMAASTAASRPPLDTAESTPASRAPLDTAESTPASRPPLDTAESTPASRAPLDTAESTPASRAPLDTAESTPASRAPLDTAESTPASRAPLDTAESTPASRAPPDTAVSTSVSRPLPDMAVSTPASRPLSDTAVSTPVSRAPPKTATTTPTSRAAPDTATSTPASRPSPDMAVSMALPDMAVSTPASRAPPDTAVSRPMSDTAVSTSVSRLPPDMVGPTPTSQPPLAIYLPEVHPAVKSEGVSPEPGLVAVLPTALSPSTYGAEPCVGVCASQARLDKDGAGMTVSGGRLPLAEAVRPGTEDPLSGPAQGPRKKKVRFSMARPEAEGAVGPLSPCRTPPAARSGSGAWDAVAVGPRLPQPRILKHLPPPAPSALAGSGSRVGFAVTLPEAYEFFFCDTIEEGSEGDEEGEAANQWPDMCEFFFRDCQPQRPKPAPALPLSSPVSLSIPEAYEHFFGDDTFGGMLGPPSLLQMDNLEPTRLAPWQAGPGSLLKASTDPAEQLSLVIRRAGELQGSLPSFTVSQKDLCLVFVAFATWAVRTSDLQTPDAWKTVLLANLGTVSAIRYFRRQVGQRLTSPSPSPNPGRSRSPSPRHHPSS